MKGIKGFLPYILFTLIVVLCGIFGGDKWYNILFSAIAVIYLSLLTDGLRCGYLLCSVYAAGYAAISLRAGFYATAVFHAFFLLPSSIYRFFASGKRAETAVKSLSFGARALSVLLCAALSVGLYFLLRRTGDARPLLDGVILALSLLTSAMMAGNYREMWAFNLAASALYVVMWSAEFFSNGTGIAFAIMQSIVSIINIKGIVSRKKRD